MTRGPVVSRRIARGPAARESFAMGRLLASRRKSAKSSAELRRGTARACRVANEDRCKTACTRRHGASSPRVRAGKTDTPQADPHTTLATGDSIL